MPLPSSGTLSFYTIAQGTLTSSYTGPQTSVIAMNKMYKGGIYFPNMPVAANNTLPASGAISVSQLYGVYGFKTFTTTMTVGSVSYVVGKTGYSKYGYSKTSWVDGGKAGLIRTEGVNYNYFNWAQGAFGSLSSSTFTNYFGTQTIVGIYYRGDDNSWHAAFYSSGGVSGADADYYITQIVVSGYVTLVRSSRSGIAGFGQTGEFLWAGGTFPTGGSVSVTYYYYG